MTVPLVILAVCSVVVGGYFACDRHGFAEFPAPTRRRWPSRRWPQRRSSREFHTDVARAQHGLVALAGIGAGRVLVPGRAKRRRTCWPARCGRCIALSHGKFFFDEIYSALIVWPLRLSWPRCATRSTASSSTAW